MVGMRKHVRECVHGGPGFPMSTERTANRAHCGDRSLGRKNMSSKCSSKTQGEVES